MNGEYGSLVVYRCVGRLEPLVEDEPPPRTLVADALAAQLGKLFGGRRNKHRGDVFTVGTRPDDTPVRYRIVGRDELRNGIVAELVDGDGR